MTPRTEAHKVTLFMGFSRQKYWSGNLPGSPVAKMLSPNPRGLGSIPGQGARPHMPKLTVHMLQLKPGSAKYINKIQDIIYIYIYKEYWSGLPFPSPGDLPDPGIKCMSLVSPAWAGQFFTASAT